MNKMWNTLYGLKNKPAIEREHRVRESGKGYDKVKEILQKNGLELYCNNRKWYSVFDNGNNVRFDIFDTMQDVKDWIKNDMQEYLKTREVK